MLTQQRTKTQKRGLLGTASACMAVGGLASTGQATVAVAMVCLLILGTLMLLERKRMAPLLWASVGFTAPFEGVRLAPVLALSDVLLIAAFMATLPDVFQGRRRVVPGGVLTAFSLLILAGLIGTFFAPDVSASLTNLIKVVLAAAGSVVAMASWDPGPARLRQFAWLWFAGAVTSAAVAAITPRTFAGRAAGLTNHPNHFGLTCSLGIGLGVGLALSSTGRTRSAAVFGIVLLTAGVGLSGSRAALLGTAITVALTAILAKRFRLLVAAVVVVVLGAIVIILGLIHIPDTNALSRLAGGGSSRGSDLGRLQAAADAFASISRHPFTGEGFEHAQDAHNLYLQVLVVGGPVALLSFLAVAGLTIRHGLRALRSEGRRSNGPVLAGLLAGYAGYLASGTFHNILWNRYLWTYIGLLIVLATSIRRPAPSPPPVDALNPGRHHAPVPS